MTMGTEYLDIRRLASQIRSLFPCNFMMTMKSMSISTALTLSSLSLESFYHSPTRPASFRTSVIPFGMFWATHRPASSCRHAWNRTIFVSAAMALASLKTRSALFASKVKNYLWLFSSYLLSADTRAGMGFGSNMAVRPRKRFFTNITNQGCMPSIYNFTGLIHV